MGRKTLKRRAVSVAVGTAVAAVIAGSAMPAWADTVVAQASKTGVSDDVELYAFIGLRLDTSNRYYASGYDVELHEYQRVHNVVVTLEQRNASGSWVVAARAASHGVEGAAATTGTQPAGPTFRACISATVDDGAPVAVCTA